MHECVGNLHAHTPYSDGHAYHNEIAAAGLAAGLDFVVVTDHNVLVEGVDGYRYKNEKRILLLTGEEIHDPRRMPQKNHLLVYEAGTELAPLAGDPQQLIEAVARAGGLSFLAHPVDPGSPIIPDSDLSWVDWNVTGFTGIELWNYMTEFKSRLRGRIQALYYAYAPRRFPQGPFPEALSRWDQMLASGLKVVAIGGADAHALPVRWGPLRKTIFEYEWCFRAVNTHVLLHEPLTGDVSIDRRRLFGAIRAGRCHVGYDMENNSRGFRFSANSKAGEAGMGDSLPVEYGVTFQVRTPAAATIRLIQDGRLREVWSDVDQAVITVREAGAYRVEAYRTVLGRSRGWIFSNPIYLTA